MWSHATRGLQRRINRLIPERVHETVTTVIKQMTRAVIAGSSFTAPAPLRDRTLAQREVLVAEKIENYSRTAAIEGGVTGAGGFLFGLADFPLLLEYQAEAPVRHRRAVWLCRRGLQGAHLPAARISARVLQRRASPGRVSRHAATGALYSERLPASLDDFDWRTFQQEYRDYIDLAKLAQLLPIIGAPVGVIVNNRLVRRLGRTAINAYRMRWFADREPHINRT